MFAFLVSLLARQAFFTTVATQAAHPSNQKQSNINILSHINIAHFLITLTASCRSLFSPSFFFGVQLIGERIINNFTIALKMNWPRRPKPEEALYRSPRIREENFAVAEKMSIFQEQGSQGIAEKYTRDCRNFVGGRINTRRSLGAESLHEILK